MTGSHMLITALIILAAALIIAFLRFLKGPSIADRIVALDLIAMLIGGIIGIYSVFMQQEVFMDVIGALALISFIGTVAFARYLEKRACH